MNRRCMFLSFSLSILDFFCCNVLVSFFLLLCLCLCQMDQPSMDQKGHANVPWIVEPGQEAKRGVNTKYETTIF